MPALAHLRRRVIRALPPQVKQQLRRVRSRVRAMRGAPEPAGSHANSTVKAVRALLHDRKLTEARAMAATLSAHPDTAALGALLTGLIACRQGHSELALASFEAAPREDVLRLAPGEYFRTLFLLDPVRGLTAVRRALHEDLRLPAHVWYELVKRTFAQRDAALSKQVFAKARAVQQRVPDRWRNGELQLDWLERWIDLARFRSAPPPPEGRISFGMIDYTQPGRAATSCNIGDHIQTLASLGHVARQQKLSFHGPDDAVDFMTRMQQRVKPELHLDTVTADVELHRVSRDASTYQEFPENTWLLEFGWHMHGLFDLEVYDFPMHPNLKPIFVSFHCRKRGMMTPEAIEYLRAHAPVGCRDWATVDLLLSLGVPAFFSGCLTTTVDAVFPELDERPTPRTLYVEPTRTPIPDGIDNVKQSYPEVRDRTFIENMDTAVELLEDYRRNYTDVVTLRLHCYLPTTSLGLNATFEPVHNADERFVGLFRLSHDEVAQMRDSMRARLQPVLEAILSGAAEEDVYRTWAEVNADDVALARERHEAPVPDDPAVADLISTARAAVEPTAVPGAATTGAGPAVAGVPIDVVCCTTAGLVQQARTMVASARDTSSRPVRGWLVGPIDPASVAAVPGVELHVVDTREIDRQDWGVKDARWLHRPLLGELLPVDRAVVVPADALVVADLAELADLPLGPHLVAARTTSSASRSGFGRFYTAAYRSDDTPDVAYEFYRRVPERHTFDFDAFDIGVMVLDLARMREQESAADMLDGMRRYRLNHHEAMLWTFGADRIDLDPQWGYVPDRDPAGTPRIWHWADATKPWSQEYVAGRELWQQAKARVDAR